MHQVKPLSLTLIAEETRIVGSSSQGFYPPAGGYRFKSCTRHYFKRASLQDVNYK